MRFAVGDGYAAAGQGVGNLLGAIFQAPHAREMAQQKAAQQAAQTYAATMQGNKYGAEAEGLAMTNQNRIAPLPEDLPVHLRQSLQGFQVTGDPNLANQAKLMESIHKLGLRDRATEAALGGDLNAGNVLNTYTKDGAAYLPFDNVGNTGRALNQATGEGVVLDAVLAKLFDNEMATQAGANNARAAASYASANNSNANAAFTQDKHGFFTETGALPAARGTGEDATNAKARNAIIAAVERELMGAGDTEIMAEVERRLARRGIGAGAQSPAAVPKAGTVEDGYRFKGGDPANPQNWEKL